MKNQTKSKSQSKASDALTHAKRATPASRSPKAANRSARSPKNGSSAVRGGLKPRRNKRKLPAPSAQEATSAMEALVQKAVKKALAQTETTPKPAAAPVIPSVEQLQAFRSLLHPEYDDNDQFNTNGLNYVGPNVVVPPVPGTAVVAQELARRNDGNLSTYVAEVLENMTANADRFTAPQPTLNVVQAALADFLSKMSSAESLRVQAVNAKRLKDMQRGVLENLLRSLGLYVQTISQGDASVIGAAGMRVKNGRSPKGMLLPPATLTASASPTSGGIDLRWPAVRGGEGYIVRCSLDLPVREWSNLKRCSKNRLLVPGLEVGKAYVFQAATAGGATGQSDWGPEAKRVCA